MEMLSTCPPFDPENILPFHGLAVLMFEDAVWSYAPRLDVSPTPSRIPFKDWWEGVIFSDSKNRALTRADVVLTAANQDGGAHVDGEIREDYAELHFENSLGWVDEQGKPPSGDVRYVAIRQMAHEVLKTFVPGYSKTLEDVHTSRRQAEISVGKMCFYPHQHRGFINNLADPLTPGTHYLAEIFIDSITTGSVYMVLNSAKSEYVNRPGRYRAIVQAGVEGGFGVFGEHTDAIVDKVSLTQIIMPH